MALLKALFQIALLKAPFEMALLKEPFEMALSFRIWEQCRCIEYIMKAPFQMALLIKTPFEMALSTGLGINLNQTLVWELSLKNGFVREISPQ